MKRNWGKIRRFIPMYLMLLPGLVYLFINNYMPMAGIIIAFKKYNYSLAPGPEGHRRTNWQTIYTHIIPR